MEVALDRAHLVEARRREYPIAACAVPLVAQWRRMGVQHGGLYYRMAIGESLEGDDRVDVLRKHCQGLICS